MLYKLTNLEGWRSGQSQQTVNLPSLALRWFKSSSLHQILFIFILALSVTSQILATELSSPFKLDKPDYIQQKVNAYIEHDKISYRSLNQIKLIQSASYFSLFLINKKADIIDLSVSGIYLYKYFYSPEYKSQLLKINATNAHELIPKLQNTIKRKRKSLSLFRLLSGLSLAIYVSSNSLDTDKTISLTSVASELIAMGFIRFNSKSANEVFLDNLNKEYKTHQKNTPIGFSNHN
jgi:hypothetical protein